MVCDVERGLGLMWVDWDECRDVTFKCTADPSMIVDTAERKRNIFVDGAPSLLVSFSNVEVQLGTVLVCFEL